LNYRLTREEFEEAISEWNSSIANLYKSVVEEANLTLGDIDFIELIGGITRVPFVQSVLIDVSGLEKLNRTMNSDEALAVGASYVGAAASKAFIVMTTRGIFFANSLVTIVHNGTETELFTPKSRLNETATYTVVASSLEDNITIQADGDPLTTLTLALPENVSSDDLVTLTFAFNELTLPYLAYVTVNDTNITWNQAATLPEWTLSPDGIGNSTAVIVRMDQILDERRKRDKIRNDYETYIYSTEEKIDYDETFRKVANETVRDQLRVVLAEHRQFLNEGPLNESTLNDHFNSLKDSLRSVQRRLDEYLKRGPAWQRLNASLNNVFNALNNTWPKTKPWLTEPQLNSVWRQYNQTKYWLEERYARQQNRTDDLDPAVSVAEIDTQVLLLEWPFNSTAQIRKPPPTPIPTPEPPTDSNETEANETDANETDAKEGTSEEQEPVDDGPPPLEPPPELPEEEEVDPGL
jgi:hypothetical protein